jgi:DNA-binding CsgD family transcriptional regulator/tetratricopeptide (TPR) repeat protein
MNRDLVGRSRELAVIDRSLAGSGVHAVVLVGAAGVGKTRLAREALAAAPMASRERFWVAASSSASTIPFGAVSHLVPDIDGADRFRIMHRSAEWFKARSGHGPAILGVDDAHRLDEASAALIHHLVSTGAASVIATLRSGEEVPDAITALWKDGFGERIDVGPLGRPDVVRLLDSLLGSPVQPVTEERLWQLSGGNVLYLCELVRGGLDSGALGLADGTWHWSGPVSAAPRLAELILERLKGQSDQARALVDLLAFGEPLEVSTLGRAGILPAIIEKAEQTGLVRTEATGPEVVVRLAHPLYGEIARDLAPALYRKHIARQLLETADPTDRPAGILRRAIWHLDGGSPAEPVLLRQGAVRALAVLDLTLAVRLSRASIDAGGGVESGAVLAQALILRGNTAEAEELLRHLDPRNLPVLSQAELAASRAWNLTFGLQRPADAAEILDQAWEINPLGRDVLAAQRASLLSYAGHPVKALAATELESGIRHPPDTTTVRKLTARCECLAVQGRCVDAVEAGQQAVKLNTRILGGDWSMSQDEAEASLVGAMILCGQLDDAEELINTGYLRALAARWDAGAGMWSVWRGEIRLARGQPASASRCFQAALAAATGDHHPYRQWLIRLAANDLARAAALCGDAALAASAVATAEEQARPWMGALDVWGGSSQAWLAVAQNDSKRGIRLALAAAGRARQDHQHGWEILALHQVIRFGEPHLANHRIHELAQKVDSPLAPLYAGHGTALAAGDGTALDRIAQAFHGHGFVLLAAEAAAHAAHAHRHAGLLAAAGASARLAHALAAGCEGARTPALSLLADPVSLTRRETEIARLAATGLTNAGIAANLVISVRTVENILHHVYDKLALTGRQDLPGVFNLPTQPPAQGAATPQRHPEK